MVSMFTHFSSVLHLFLLREFMIFVSEKKSLMHACHFIERYENCIFFLGVILRFSIKWKVRIIFLKQLRWWYHFCIYICFLKAYSVEKQKRKNLLPDLALCNSNLLTQHEKFKHSLHHLSTFIFNFIILLLQDLS